MIEVKCDICNEPDLRVWYLVEITYQMIHDKRADDTTTKIYCETCAVKKGITKE